MSPQTAATFIQAIPVMFIIVFIGEQRITRTRPRWIISRIGILVVLLLAPAAVAMLAVYVINDEPAPFPMNWITWISTLGLAVAMMNIALAELAQTQNRTDDNDHGENENGSD